MDSEKFIEALESCPYEDLTKNLGIKDNWVIYLNGNLGNIITQLCQDNKYSSIEADILYDEQNGVLVRVLDEPIALLGVEVDDARLCQAARAQCDLYGFTIRREKRGKEIVCVIIPNRPAVQAAQS